MILDGVGAALRFLPRAWSRPWFLGMLAVALVFGLLAMSVGRRAPWLSPVLALSAFIYLPLIQAPLYGLAMEGRGPPFALAARRWVRLVAVNLLTNIFLAVPLLLIFLVGLATAYAMAFSYVGFDPGEISTWTAGGPVLIGAEVVMALGGVALAWLSARVALGPAATIAEGRVLMLSTWPVTRGRGVAIMISRFLLTLPILIVLIAVLIAVNRAPPTAWYARAIPLIANLLIVGLRLPLKVGLMVFFYERRAPLPPSPAP